MNEFKTTNNLQLFNYHNDLIPYISYKRLDDIPFIKNAFTLRNSLSGTPLKMFWHDGENIDEVKKCNSVLAAQLGTDLSRRVSAQQKHTANVHLITKEDLGSNIKLSHIENTDALISNIPNTLISISVADCIPLLFVDKNKKAIGAAHAGRKGTQHFIGHEVVKAMQENFDSDPADIIATIGPGICADCYEVGPEIFDEFIKDFGREYSKKIFKQKNGKYYLDLWLANRLTLLDAGVKEENIITTNICNRCNCDKFYSFRADKRIINQISASILLK